MEDDRRAQTLLMLLAVYLMVDMLLLMPVIVIALKWPGLIWFAIGPYLLFTLAILGLILYLAWRWGLMELSHVHYRDLRKAAMALGISTGIYVAIVIAWPGAVAASTVLYCAGIGYAVYRLVKWEAAHLAFACQLCGAVFAAGVTVWLLSPNMGSRKWVTCAVCGKHTLARIVDADATPSSD